MKKKFSMNFRSTKNDDLCDTFLGYFFIKKSENPKSKNSFLYTLVYQIFKIYISHFQFLTLSGTHGKMIVTVISKPNV